jgi:hypothetical protein
LGRDAPAQRRGQPLRGRLDPLVRQGGQRGRIGLAGDQGLDDGAPAHPRDVGQHRGELDVGVLQRLLQPLDVAGALADQLLAGAQQDTQRLGGRVGDEAGAHQAVGEQLGQPGRVGHVGLAAGHVLHLRRVGQHQGEIAVGQDVPDRLPVDAGRFHGDMRAAALGQPGGQRQQPGRGGGEGLHLNADTAAAGQASAGHNGVFVHVQASATGMENLHRALLHRAAGVGRPFGEL